MSRYVEIANIGQITLTDLDIELLRTKPLLRLRKLRQLSFCDSLNLYGQNYIGSPGANSDRLTHSFQVEYFTWLNLRWNQKNSSEKKLGKSSALLHDVGHPTFSHALEMDGRISNEKRAEELILRSEISDILKNHGVEPMQVLDIVNEKRKGYFSDIIAGEVGMDRVAYVTTDNHHISISPDSSPYDASLPLIQKIREVEGVMSLPISVPFEELGKASFDDIAILDSAYRLLERRTYLFMKPYGSVTNRSAVTIMRNAVQIAIEEGFDNIKLHELYDVQILAELREVSPEVAHLIDMIENGKIPSPIFEMCLQGESAERVQRLRENRDERLKFEEQVGQGDKVYLDIDPMGKSPKGDTNVSYYGNMMPLKDA
ncbi:MAG: HD domain-containing protein, partial [Candidatus Aenigmatarchaeota archaeon]